MTSWLRAGLKRRKRELNKPNLVRLCKLVQTRRLLQQRNARIVLPRNEKLVPLRSRRLVLLRKMKNLKGTYTHCMRIFPQLTLLYTRHKISLTDEQVTVLLRRVPSFRVADPDTRTTIIQAVVTELERSWSQETGFDRSLVERVQELSAICFPSHTFVDGLQIFIP